MEVLIVIGIAAGTLAGAVVGIILGRKVVLSKVKVSETRSSEIIEEAQKKADGLIKESERIYKEHENRLKELDNEARDKKNEARKREERLIRREENIEKKGDLLNAKESDIYRREKLLTTKEKELQEKTKKYDEMLAHVKGAIEQAARMTQEEARQYLMNTLLEEVKFEAAKEIKKIEDEAKEEAEKRAKRVIATTICRYAGDVSNERTVSVVNLPNDDMKGRIIGREGRNIRAFEAATGIDLIIDDTPEAVILSGFNPVRREVARVSLEKLISDGRIHPARIEEIVEKTTKEVEQSIKAAGEEAIFQLGITSMHPELVKLVGRLKYRTSYAQNVLSHSIEVAFLCGLMAAELKINVKDARRAGLLHDIGKGVDQEFEGPHAVIGGNLARKYGENAEVVNAIAAHHDDEPPVSVLAYLVTAADALSGARPGARRETLESYIKRLEELEEISNSFKGVEKSYAIQAGREIRIIVESAQITDEGVSVLARDVAKKIEEKLTYPGQIKVCVIRETRAVQFAK
ncbi:MAG: ribonuclease Y [Deltaproteobacteria bacterium]|nr:ribonuclease Y [Deltaproteobacteria bacterium]